MQSFLFQQLTRARWSAVSARHKSLICLLVLGWLCLPTLPGAGRLLGADPLADYNLAVGLYKQSRWKPAAESFRTYLMAHPTHERVPAARLYLGLTYINLEDFTQSRNILRRFVEDYPENSNLAQARYRVAECSYLLGEWEAAATEFAAYLKEHPADSYTERALPYLGDAQLRLKQPTAALGTFDRALAEHPQGALIDDVRFGRARALSRTGQREEALRALAELAALEASERADDAQFALAELHFEDQRYAEAVAAYQQLEAKFPQSPLLPTAILNSGYGQYRIGEFLAAAATFERAAATPRQAGMGAYWCGLSYKQAGQPEDALTALRRAEQALAADDPLQESVLFQQGVCERLAGRWPNARDLFIKVADRWPGGEFADDSVYSAADAALEAGDIKQSAELLERFQQNYATSGLRLYGVMLAGRLDLARVTADPPLVSAEERLARLEAATVRFEQVLKESTIERTRDQARYDLALARQLQGRSADAISTIEPLVAQYRALQPVPPEIAEALLLAATAHSSLKQWEPAEAAARDAQSLIPSGRHVSRAIALAAIAAAQQGDATTVQSNAANAIIWLDRLQQEFPGDRLIGTTLFQVAGVFETRKDWPTAALLYRRLVEVSRGTENQAFALRGLGWALFEQQLYLDAAEQFRLVTTDFAAHRLAPEAGYYRAEALRLAAKGDEAIVVYQEVFDRHSPAEPAIAGAEQAPPLLFAFRAGLQRARTLRTQNQVSLADEAYDRLIQKFPKPANLDRLLQEWALLNYEAENYDRADRLFRRLVEEVPTSELADNAQLSLAESELVAERLDAAEQLFTALATATTSDPQVQERSLFQLLVLALDRRQWPRLQELATQLDERFPMSEHRPFATLCRAEATLAATGTGEADWQSTAVALEALRARRGEPAAAEWPWLPRAWVLGAEAAVRLKQYDVVERLAKELTEQGTAGAYVYQIDEVLGRAYQRQARFDEARAAFERVTGEKLAYRTETAAKAQFLLAETYFLQERWADAFLAYQRVYTSYSYPEWQAAALLQSAKCDEQQGQWPEAVRSYDQLLKEFPQSTHATEAGERVTLARQKAGG